LWWEKKGYLEKSQERISESLKDVVDFNVKFIGAEKWPPSLENRMRNLQDTDVGSGILGLEF
jgi:hypothetical protein